MFDFSPFLRIFELITSRSRITINKAFRDTEASERFNCCIFDLTQLFKMDIKYTWVSKTAAAFVENSQE